MLPSRADSASAAPRELGEKRSACYEDLGIVQPWCAELESHAGASALSSRGHPPTPPFTVVRSSVDDSMTCSDLIVRRSPPESGKTTFPVWSSILRGSGSTPRSSSSRLGSTNNSPLLA
jgi:hypothetical protein